MTEFARSCVQTYLELVGGDTGQFKRVRSLWLSKADPDPKGLESRGRLTTCAASVLMQVLYSARQMRFDLQKPVQALASRIHKWTEWCDEALHRLM